ncbi:MAG: hypothetical protein PHS25_04520 [Proteiniphilum sp.]|jgi:hypothetical protein|nr:hypothetical protein [Proteiniphilum sp.]MDY0100355.1 hypothetical protein [Bacteroidales bacterium]NCB24505.1 hypothetical protein [Bacteroidia bacterium]MDD2937542.1 hypothetical protein [Proteiniphilum sp.]MDD3778629.1 hypothetical protein [Proteiniphilum sp.]
MKAKISKLDEIDKAKNPFKVPENYFALLNEEIMSRLPEKEYVAPPPVTLWEKVKPWVYMAAMFIGIYIIVNYLTSDASKKPLMTESTTSEAIGTSETVDNYWSTVHVTEEEFYQFLEEQVVEDGYYDYMYNQYYLN